VYYVPGIIALGVIAACFGNLVASVTAQRERGVLKRRRATPVPAGALIAGRVLTAVATAVVMAAVLLGIGWAAYGARVPGRTAPALAAAVVVGAASFCCLGYALTSLIRNEDLAQRPTERWRPPAKSRAWDSPSSSTPSCGPGPKRSRSAARNAVPRSNPPNPAQQPAGTANAPPGREMSRACRC